MSVPYLHRMVPTSVLGQTDTVGVGRSRAQGRGSVGIVRDRFDSRRRPRQVLPDRPAAALPHARSGVTGHSKQAGTLRNQSAVQNLLWFVQRPCAESSLPVSLIGGLARSLTRSGESTSSSPFLENRPPRTSPRAHAPQRSTHGAGWPSFSPPRDAFRAAMGEGFRGELDAEPRVAVGQRPC